MRPIHASAWVSGGDPEEPVQPPLPNQPGEPGEPTLPDRAPPDPVA